MVVDKVIHITRTTFIHGCHISEAVVVLNEVVNEFHRTNVQIIILKISFEKAYDKVQLVYIFRKERLSVSMDTMGVFGGGNLKIVHQH